MKSKLLLWMPGFLVVAGIVILSGCKKKSDELPEEAKFEQTIYVNPEDARIISFDSAGRKVVYMGTKDADGLPISITKAVVDAPDLDPQNQTLIEFDNNGRVTSLTSQKEGFMEFNYISDTTVVIIYTLPDNQGSFQLSYNPENPGLKSGGCGCPGKSLIAEPISMIRDPLSAPPLPFTNSRVSYQGPLSPTKPTGEGDIYLLYNITAQPVTGGKPTGKFETKEGQTGDVDIKADGVGHFLYSFPTQPAPPAPPPGFTGKAQTLLNYICIGAIPVGFGVGKICLSTLNPVTVAACTAILTAYVWTCRSNTVQNVGGFFVDLFTSEATVIVTVKHPVFPTQTKSASCQPASGFFSDLYFGYADYAVILNLYTTPADPDPSQGYIITATVENGVPGSDEIRLSMVGTDGYTQSETFTLSSSKTYSISIPGASQGVMDEITAEVLNYNPPQPGQSMTITIVF